MARGPTCRPRVNDPCSSRLFMTNSDGADSRFRPKEVGFSGDASFDAGRGQPPHCVQSQQQLLHPSQDRAQRVAGERCSLTPIRKEPLHHPAGVARSHQEHARACRSLTASMPQCLTSMSTLFHFHFERAAWHGPPMVHGPSVGRPWAVVDGRGAMRCPCSTGPQGVRAPGRAPGPNKGQGQRISLGVCNLVVAVRVCMTDMRM